MEESHDVAEPDPCSEQRPETCPTCHMCQGTGLMAFVAPNLLRQEVPCPNCDGGKRQPEPEPRLSDL